MAEDNKDTKKGGEFRVPPRTWILWIAIIGAIPLLFLLKDPRDAQTPLTQKEFIEAWRSGAIKEGIIWFNIQDPLIQDITGTYVPKEGAAPVKFKTHSTSGRRVGPAVASQRTVRTQASQHPRAEHAHGLVAVPADWLADLVRVHPPDQDGRQRRAELRQEQGPHACARRKNKTTFKDVAGVEEAKEEVSELVEFLKDPKKFQKLGGRIPKGILMVGAPGTGKTLLAKAIAGEADASFFSISGSDFVEMFVGVGASRVRDMFEQARKNTPCLIFIDEIDAVGRSRGVGLGGGNDEREQTLNALLVEMDGFDTQEGIIIIAATNRADVLDPALLRPGRFDRQITVNLPDVRGREAILKVHARNVKLDPSVDLSVTARGTPGYSGAELANLLERSGAARGPHRQESGRQAELEEARDKVRWGRERRSLAMTDENKKLTAWHEAGHALVNVMLKHTHPLHKVTIIPRGPSLGSTMSLPKEDILNYQRRELEDMIAMTMAGRIAEEIVSGDISTGAGGDIQQATNMARAMVCQYGMSDKLGMVQYSEDDEYFLGRDMMRRKSYSEATAQEIDGEVGRSSRHSIERAHDIDSQPTATSSK